MGIFGYLLHRKTRGDIAKVIDVHRGYDSDKRAGALFYAWLIRGMNLAPTHLSHELIIPIYYYKRGAESVLVDLISGFQRSRNFSMCNAARIHFFTNLAVSYPQEGYGTLVRQVWGELFADHTPIDEVIRELEPIIYQSQIQQLLQHNDVSVDEFVHDPKVIMPHFLVPGHPLSSRLLEEEKLARFILGE